MQCQIELGHPSFEPIIGDYYDDAVAYISCSAGHKTAVLIQSAKFEILLEAGATALLDGFTFEACACFSAALERFYEFALRVICTARDLKPDLFAGMFQEMSRQSERQLGAFLMLYAIEFGTAYKPDQKITEFRNSIIHKGTIPTVEQAHQFSSRIYAAIYSLYQALQQKHATPILQVTMQTLQERQARVPTGMRVATSTGTMFFNMVKLKSDADFEAALEGFKKARGMMTNSIPHMQALHDQIRSQPNQKKNSEFSWMRELLSRQRLEAVGFC